MKKIFPKLYNDQLLICVGDNETQVEFVVGESILNTSSEREKMVWKRAIRVALINDFENLIDTMVSKNFPEAFKIFNELQSQLKEYDANWQQGIASLKKMLGE